MASFGISANGGAIRVANVLCVSLPSLVGPATFNTPDPNVCTRISVQLKARMRCQAAMLRLMARCHVSLRKGMEGL